MAEESGDMKALLLVTTYGISLQLGSEQASECTSPDAGCVNIKEFELLRYNCH